MALRLTRRRYHSILRQAGDRDMGPREDSAKVAWSSRTLALEYKLDAAHVQYARMDAAIRSAQFVRNKSLRVWMDVPGTTASDLQVHCSELAHYLPFAAHLNYQA